MRSLASTRRPARLRQAAIWAAAHPQAYDQHSQPFYFPDLEGAAYKSKVTVFAVIGIFILGVIFGPLAILNAGRAEAHGVQATFGKVAGCMVVVALATGASTRNS